MGIHDIDLPPPREPPVMPASSSRELPVQYVPQRRSKLVRNPAISQHRRDYMRDYMATRRRLAKENRV